MLLVIDVGNTNVVLGIYDNKNLIKSWRMSTDVKKSSDEIGITLMQFFKYGNIKSSYIENVIISSVVPPIMHSLKNAIRKYLSIEPIIVGPGIKTGINIKYDNPKEVGADRIVNAVAGFKIYGGPLIIVDFGTATTFCAISCKGEYLGGVICPGIKISIEALFEKASKLPRIQLIKPEKVIGKNTVTSMQSGIIYGYAGKVDYITKKMKAEMQEKDAKVIATGGLAKLIATEAKSINKIDDNLTLKGLRIIYQKNFEND